jgi:hypothetical protein
MFGALLAACGGDASSVEPLATAVSQDSTSTSLAVEESPGASDGELMEVVVPDDGMAIGEVLMAGAGPVVVYGQLFDDGEGLRLCGGLTKALPPICVGDFLWIDGLDTAGLTFEETDGIVWSEGAFVLEGILDVDTLRDARLR